MMECSVGSETNITFGPFKANRCYYIDSAVALKSLPAGSIDLCLTDPPYRIEWQGFGHNKTWTKERAREYNASKVFYKDPVKKEPTWWWELVKPVINRAVFSPGYNNLRNWYMKDNFGLIIHNNPTMQGACIAAKLRKFDPFLTWNVNGQNGTKKFMFGIIKSISRTGFFDKENLVHPCPKPYELFKQILVELEPKSVIDIFMGSGTTAQAAESLGIPWLGFEIMKEYKQDIDKKIQKGMKIARKKEQVTIGDLHC